MASLRPGRIESLCPIVDSEHDPVTDALVSAGSWMVACGGPHEIAVRSNGAMRVATGHTQEALGWIADN